MADRLNQMLARLDERAAPAQAVHRRRRPRAAHARRRPDDRHGSRAPPPARRRGADPGLAGCRGRRARAAAARAGAARTVQDRRGNRPRPTVEQVDVSESAGPVRRHRRIVRTAEGHHGPPALRRPASNSPPRRTACGVLSPTCSTTPWSTTAAGGRVELSCEVSGDDMTFACATAASGSARTCSPTCSSRSSAAMTPARRRAAATAGWGYTWSNHTSTPWAVRASSKARAAAAANLLSGCPGSRSAGKVGPSRPTSRLDATLSSAIP